ncbi:hypothetical protein E4198_04165 [Streptomyces sp. RKND-216]|uniref:DUF3592 domain-containing protein n=1 Tax=Streptomyces sp. RKND-216 TaxID=2562581 RepID=UPI00109DCD64|nr:DUF3592 domain-containing protein [Streptomyces sp. RKND-216]THA24034.1 hypothetical protein E4198_04165 [Streptomyces sp. RKND-216]
MARVLTAYHAPLPRWDLIACFVVAGLGVTGCLVTVRIGRCTDLGSPPPHRWWPDPRATSIGWPLAAWLLTLATIAFSMTAYSTDAGRVAAAGHTFKQVSVVEVMSSRHMSGRHVSGYETEIRAQVQFYDGSEKITSEFTSPRALQPGDRIWALYAPSAPEAGALLHSSRTVLERELGGPLGGSLGTFIVLLPYVMWLFRAGRATGGWLPVSLAVALRLGRVQSCAVRAVGGTAITLLPPATTTGEGRETAPKGGTNDREPQLRPCLTLETADGTPLTVALDHEIDAVALAAALASSGPDSSLTLYWMKTPAVGTTVTSVSRDLTTVDGALIVNADRALPCWVISGEVSDPTTGKPVPAAEATQWAELPKLARFPPWNPSLHTAALVTLLLTCLLLGVIAIGVGVVWTIILAVVALLLPLVAAAAPTLLRQERLEALTNARGRSI